MWYREYKKSINGSLQRGVDIENKESIVNHFQSGVLIMNLEEMRKIKYSENFKKFAIDYLNR